MDVLSKEIRDLDMMAKNKDANSYATKPIGTRNRSIPVKNSEPVAMMNFGSG